MHSEYLAALYDARLKLIRGDRVVRIGKGDQTIEYGIVDLPKIDAAIRAEEAAEYAKAGTPRHYRVATSKGL